MMLLPFDHRSGLSFLATALILVSMAAVSSAQPQAGTAIGPGVGGQVHAVALDPDYPDVIYAGGDVCGVYKYSIIAGSWTPWSRGLGFADLNWSYYVDDLLVLRAADNVPIAFRGVYAATWGGVYFRPDDQTPWTCLSTGAVYSTGFAADRGGSMRIPFSSLAYDSVTQTLYAGAGHGRTEDQFEGRYRGFYPTSTCSADSCPEEYSLWSCDLSGAMPVPEFQTVSGTDRGKTRQIAIADYIDSEQVPRHEVIYSTNTGIWTVGAPDPLWSVVKPNKSQEFDPATDASVPWGVVVGSDATCYIVTWPPALTMKSGIWKYDLKIRPRGENSPVWSRVVGESDYFWPHAETFSQFLINSGGDLSDLSIVWNEDGGRDALYLGAGAKEAARPGYLRYGDYNLGGTPTWGWANVHGKHNNGLGYPMGAEMFVADWRHGQIDSTHLSADEVGWHSYDFSMRSLTQFAVNRAVDTIMVAVDYAVPMLTTNGGESWQNLYCSGSHAAGWTTRGLNLLCTGSSTFLPDGRLVIGALDYGVFVGSESANTSFFPIHEGSWDYKPDYPSAVDVEVLSPGGQAEYFMVDSGRALSTPNVSVIWTWVESESRWRSISDDLDVDIGLADEVKLNISDIVFADENHVYAAVGADVTPAGVEFPQYHFRICEGQRPASGTDWVWTTRLNFDAAKNESRFVNKLSLVPGANLLMVAAKFKGDSPGGLYPVDLATWELGSAWLGGTYNGQSPPPADALGRLGVNVTSVAVDRLGRYLYAGTAGGDNTWTPARGGLVRFALVNGVPGPPEILAGAGDVETSVGDAFEIGEVSGFDAMPHGTTQAWEFCTRINDIEIDPNNPRVAYVAVGAGNIPFYHEKFGAWRVSDAGRTHLWGGNETGSGAKTVGISPVDRAHLYVGSVGQEFFRANIIASEHPAIADTTEFPVLTGIGNSVTLSVRIASVDSLEIVTADLSGLGLADSVVTLMDDGKGDDIMRRDGIFTASNVASSLEFGQSYSVRVFAQAYDGGYDQQDVVVSLVESTAKFVNKSQQSGDLKDLLLATPYSAVYFQSGVTDTTKIMVVTFDDNSTPPLLVRQGHVQEGVPNFESRGFGEIESWLEAPLPSGSRGVCYADYDNDGDSDIFICNPTYGGKLFENRLDATPPRFVNVTSSICGTDSTYLAGAITASWGDYNGDGFVDLFVGTTNYFDSVKYLDASAVGSITYAPRVFKNSSGKALSNTIWGAPGTMNICLAGCWADLENDGDLDLITTRFVLDEIAVLQNNGFLYSVLDNVLAYTTWTIPDDLWGANSVSVIDYDHNEYPDLLITEPNNEYRVKILKNNFGESGIRSFTPIVVSSGTLWNGAVVADFNLDGQDDFLLLPAGDDTGAALFMATEYSELPSYRDVGYSLGLRDGAAGGGIAADFDGDRALDLFLGRKKTDAFNIANQFLYKNVGQAPASASWLEVQPRSLGDSNGALIGTKVSVVAASGEEWTKVVDGGSGRGGQSSSPLFFGLGDVTGNVTVNVQFPSGEVDQVTHTYSAASGWVAGEDQGILEDEINPITIKPTFRYELQPGTMDWVFSWRTHLIKGDLRQDKVSYKTTASPGDPCYDIGPSTWTDLIWGAAGVSNLAYKDGDYWQHELRLSGLECMTGCLWYFNTTSGVGSTGMTVPSQQARSTSINYCLPE